MIHMKRHRREQKQKSSKIFKRPLLISSPMDVVGNTPGAQSLLMEGSIPLQQHTGRLTKPPVVFSESHEDRTVEERPVLSAAGHFPPINPTGQSSPRAQLGRAREALGSHPPYGELRTRTANPRRHGRVFSQSQLTSALASIEEESPTDNGESNKEQEPSLPATTTTNPEVPFDFRRSALDHAWQERQRHLLFVKQHTPAIQLVNRLRAVLSPYINPRGRMSWTRQLEAAVRSLAEEKQAEAEAVHVLNSLWQLFAPLVERDESISRPAQLETIIRSLVHDQREESGAVITLNNLWLLLNPDIPQDEDVLWVEALETKIREMNEDYKGMTNALDRIDAAVRPSVTEEAVDEAFWYTRLETAVQSLVEERNRMQCEVVNSKAIAEHSQRLAMSNQRKLEEAEKELRRLRRALDAYSPEEEEMPEYIPLAVGSQRHRPLWPLR